MLSQKHQNLLEAFHNNPQNEQWDEQCIKIIQLLRISLMEPRDVSVAAQDISASSIFIIFLGVPVNESCNTRGHDYKKLNTIWQKWYEFLVGLIIFTSVLGTEL